MNLPDGSALTVGAHRAPVAYNPAGTVHTALSPEFFTARERVVPLLRALSADAVRALAALCAEELETRQP